MNGKLYGIGVGPGDPELLTLKAVKTIKACDIIAVPGTNYLESVAYQIARGAVEELDQKEMIAIPMPMVKDETLLQENHKKGAMLISSFLKEGKNVGFLTLGDVCVYSTYLYVHTLVTEAGFDTEIVSGIPSFCAVAAKLNIGLVEKAEQLHVIPASYQIDEALKLPGTKVFMKSGKQIGKVKAQITEAGLQAVMIENCGMDNEKIYHHVDEISEHAGYYSLMIVKGNN